MTEPSSRAGGAIPRLFSFLAASALAAGLGAPRTAVAEYPTEIEGHASWYGPGFVGRKTASGERFDPNALTAAHRTLPLGTKVRVTNLHNGRSVLVTITDRGPYVGRRVLDLSEGAARELRMVNRGIARVLIQRI